MKLRQPLHKVTFQPDGISVHVLPGTSVLEAAGEAGIVMDTPCGGKGSCGKCRVRISRGASAPNPVETGIFSNDELSAGARLACQSFINSDSIITVPAASRFFEQKILDEDHGEAAFEPCLLKKCVKVPEASIGNPESDEVRLLDALGSDRLPLRAVQELPGMLRDNDNVITAVYDCGLIVGLEAGDTSGELFGVAFDIGTTTVVGGLVDLKTGGRLQVASRTNPQVAFGDDVVSRIEYAERSRRHLYELRSVIVNCLNEIIDELADKAGIRQDNIYEVTVAANTAMSHLFLGIDPTHIARAPYPAGARRAVRAESVEVGLSINTRGLVYVLPNIAGFVGSDTVGVILSTGLLEKEKICLAVDIGTNGEIVLGNRNKLVCCSTAAGPAFEGARIRQGMRAMPGAIEKIVMADGIAANTIGGEPPRGICGSGLIDAVAEMLRIGVLDPAGRILPENELPKSVPDWARRRLVCSGEESAFMLTTEEDGGGVALTQRDIRQVQLAKGAIFAGIESMKQEMGVSNDDISEVLLAGAMANFIRRSNAARIGLLPDVPSDRVKFIGNAALAGARMALACRSCRVRAEEISDRTHYMELAARTDFQRLFAEAMMFPEQ